MARRRKRGRPKGSKNKRKVKRKKGLAHLSPGRRKAVMAMWKARGLHPTKSMRGLKKKNYRPVIVPAKRKRNPHFTHHYNYEGKNDGLLPLYMFY